MASRGSHSPSTSGVPWLSARDLCESAREDGECEFAARALGRVVVLDASWCDLDLDEMLAGLTGLTGPVDECAIETLDISGNATIFAGGDPYATFGAVMRAMPRLADVRANDTNADASLLLACLHSLRRPIHCHVRIPAGERPAAEGLVSVTWTPLAYERAHS